MYILLNRVENIVIKVDFAHCEKAMFTSDTIFSVVCCIDVRKRLHVKRLTDEDFFQIFTMHTTQEIEY